MTSSGVMVHFRRATVDALDRMEDDPLLVIGALVADSMHRKAMGEAADVLRLIVA